jgi:hypothetical protein
MFCTSAVLQLQHCSHLYIATAVAESRLASAYLSPAEIVQASILATACSYDDDALSEPLLKRSNVVSKFPAWTAKQRPASAMNELTWQWLLPLQDLQAEFNRHLRETSKRRTVWGSSRIWQGRRFSVTLEVKTTSDAEATVALGAFMRVSDLAERSVCRTRVELQIAACGSSQDAQQQGVRKDVMLGPRVWCFTSNQGHGRSNLVELGSVSSWAAAEAKLHELGLVHSDGCLHVTVGVKDVV